MYAIYGNIYHQYTPNVDIYTSTMDRMGNIAIQCWVFLNPNLARLFQYWNTKRGQILDALGILPFRETSWHGPFTKRVLCVFWIYLVSPIKVGFHEENPY